MDSVPPALLMLAAAAIVPLLPGAARPWVVVAAPAIVLVQLMVWLDPESTRTIGWMGLELILLAVDDVNEVWATVFALVGVGGGLFGLHLRDRWQQTAILACGGSALGVLFAGDLLTLIAFWEGMAVASTILVLQGGRPRSHGAGQRYFYVHIVGGSLLLAGILWHFGETGSLAIEHVDSGAAAWLMFAGVAVNAAIVPVHAWLSDAYPEASAVGMVFLGAFTTKTAVYVMLRMFDGWDVLLVAGPAMAVYAAVFALMENDIRRLLAYHIISSVGFMVTAVGLGTAAGAASVADQVFTHVLWQAAMVMSAGAVLHATGATKLTDLGGLAGPLRWVLAAYLAGALSIAVFPLLAGLEAGHLYTEHAAGADLRWAATLLYVASVGTVLAVAVKLPYYAFFGPARDGAAVTTRVPWGMYAAMGAAAVLSIAVGVFPGAAPEVFGLHLEHAAYTTTTIVSGLQVLALSALGAWLFLPKLAGRDTVTLDADWVYRKAGRPVSALVLQPLEAAFTASEAAAAWTVRVTTRLTATPELGRAWVSQPPLGAAVAALIVTFGVVVLVAELW